MTCESFRNTLQFDDRRPEVLEHLRGCDQCLDFAAGVDPDALFRAIGGEDAIPPGGLDNFVSEVMQQVHLRDRETSIAPRTVVSWPYRWAAAAVLTFGAASSLLWNQHAALSPSVPAVAMVRPSTARVATNARPAVEDYSSTSATIVEVPTEGASDVKIVMVFDESLPSNL